MYFTSNFVAICINWLHIMNRYFVSFSSVRNQKVESNYWDIEREKEKV